MDINWTAFAVGLAIGAGLGWYMGSKAKGGGKGVTGGFASPFQSRIDRGA